MNAQVLNMCLISKYFQHDEIINKIANYNSCKPKHSYNTHNGQLYHPL